MSEEDKLHNKSYLIRSYWGFLDHTNQNTHI